MSHAGSNGGLFDSQSFQGNYATNENGMFLATDNRNDQGSISSQATIMTDAQVKRNENGLVSTLTKSKAKVAPAAPRKKKKGMKPAALADTVTRGFQTPINSGGEESDISAVSTPRMRPMKQTTPSSGNSPSIRGSSLTRAISGLKLSNEDISCNTRDSDTKILIEELSQTGSTSIPNPSGSRSVASERDPTCEENGSRKLFGAIEGGLRLDSPHRKMTASDFEPLKCLGKGAYGTVILVRQRSTGRLFAQKQLKKASLTVQKRLVEQTKNERAILESVNRHPFVVKLFYAFQDHQKLYLILEYAQGGELFHHLAMERTFTEEVAAFYMAEMVLALEYLHRDLGVVYRDLKPENCLLDAEGHLLLTDFGLSKAALEEPTQEESHGKCNSILGTIDYMAPEVVQGRPYDAAVDWWSLGALGYDLLTGAPPFSSNNHAKTEQKIVYGKLSLPYYLSPDAKDVLTRLLRKDPKKRLGGNMPKDVQVIKGHRFFRRIDWMALRERDTLAPIQPIITDPAEAENFASEFTELALSPVESRMGHLISASDNIERSSRASMSWKATTDDVFGGFSYVASRSLIDAGGLEGF